MFFFLWLINLFYFGRVYYIRRGREKNVGYEVKVIRRVEIFGLVVVLVGSLV